MFSWRGKTWGNTLLQWWPRHPLVWLLFHDAVLASTDWMQAGRHRRKTDSPNLNLNTNMCLPFTSLIFVTLGVSRSKEVQNCSLIISWFACMFFIRFTVCESRIPDFANKLFLSSYDFWKCPPIFLGCVKEIMDFLRCCLFSYILSVVFPILLYFHKKTAIEFFIFWRQLPISHKYVPHTGVMPRHSDCVLKQIPVA